MKTASKRQKPDIVVAAARAYVNSVIATLHEPFLVLDDRLRVIAANPEFYSVFALKPSGVIGQSLSKIDHGTWRIPKFERLLKGILPKKKAVVDFRFDLKCGPSKMCLIRANARELTVPQNIIDTIVSRGGSVSSRMIVLNLENITRQGELEEKYLLSETRFRRLFETTQDGVFVLDSKTGRVLEVNPYLVKLLGFPTSNFLNKPVWLCGAAKRIKDAKRLFLELVKKKYIRYENLPLATKDGRTLNVELVGNSYTVDRTTVMQCNIHDITSRVKAQNALFESEERYRKIFDESVLGMIIADEQARITQVNTKFCRMLGYTEKEMLGRSFRDFTHPDHLQEDIKSIALMQQGKKSSYHTEKRYIKKDGGIIWANTHVNLIRRPDGSRVDFQVMVEDITDRKATEDALKMSEAKYRGLYDSTADGIARQDLAGNILETNKAYRKMVGYSEKELYTMSYQRLTPTKWQVMDTAVLEHQLLRLGYCDEYEKEYIRKDGTVFPIAVRKWLIKDKLGNPIGLWGIYRDITERKRNEEAILASETKYRGLYDSIKDGIEMTDVRGRFIESNLAYREMLGYTEKELKKMTYNQIVPKKWHALELDILTNQLLKNGFSGEYEKEYIRKDGTVFPVSCRIWMIRDRQGRPIGSWGIVRDITERKKIERLKDDFASLASHQLRTPLTGTKWLVETLQEERLGPLTPKQKEYVDNIYQINERMIRLVGDMLDVIHLESGTVTFEAKPVVVCEVLDNLIGLLKTAADRKGTKIVIDCGRLHAPKLITDPKRLQTVLECLVSNAIEYSPNGKDVYVEVVEEPGMVNFIVKDSGIGIPKAEQNHIFQRFYRASNAKSQKANGTGLGLAIAQMLAKELGGEITFRSEEGKGSDFFLKLPTKNPKKTEVPKV